MKVLVILDKHDITWRLFDLPEVQGVGPHSIAVTGGPTITWFINHYQAGSKMFFVKLSGKVRPCQVMTLEGYKAALRKYKESKSS